MFSRLISLVLLALFLTSCSMPTYEEGYLINSWIEPKEVESELLEEYLLTYNVFCMSFAEDKILYIYTEEYGLEEYEWCVADNDSFEIDKIQMEFFYISKKTWDVKISHKDFAISTTGIMGACESIIPDTLPYEPLTMDEIYKYDLKCQSGSDHE